MSLPHGGVAVVTGGAGTVAGLGQGLVRQFARRGLRVVAVDRDGTAAEQVARSLRSEGFDVISCAADVTDEDDLQRAAALVESTYGACNILCAHVGGGGQVRFEDTRIADWRVALELMVVGTVATVQTFLPLMRTTTGFRRIVLTSSAAALAPGRFQGPYRAAKAAVTTIGETLDLELGPEGIGTTIAFPSGMLAPELLELARSMDLDVEGIDPVVRAITEEMAPDATDIATGASAAVPIVDAVALGKRYVVTHGVTVSRATRSRQALLDEAFTDAARRDQA
jgi:NAD(P)-dependent dehydrogenase (short-subunit alcohol dehydrogenase family)